MLRQENFENHSKSNINFFNNTLIEEQANLLRQELSKNNVREIVGYKIYNEQTKIGNFLGKDCKDASKILEKFMEKFDVNFSDRYGLTLLHNLLWYDRPDLAKTLLENPKFKKINFKFCLPTPNGSMYVSALDLAIAKWQGKEPGFDLNFLDLLLKNGAQSPNPEKKFFDAEFLPFFYPIIVFKKEEFPPEAFIDDSGKPFEPCNSDELIKLFCLLSQYDFSISAMEKSFNSRLFNTENSFDNRASEFEEKFNINVQEQKSRLDNFMQKLKQAISDKNTKGVVIAEMDQERLSNGEDTLDLPFDPHDKPCCIM